MRAAVVYAIDYALHDVLPCACNLVVVLKPGLI